MSNLSKYLLLALLLRLSLSTYSQIENVFSITGHLANVKNNVPVQGALVQVLNSNYNTISDIKGDFKLNIPHKQHISLLIKHASFNNKIKELDINDTSKVFMCQLF